MNKNENCNKILVKDMQNTHGLIFVSFDYEEKEKKSESENDLDNLNENNANNEIRNDENNVNNEHNNNNNNLNNSDEEFNENTSYEELVRIGFKITPKSLNQVQDESKSSSSKSKENNNNNNNEENVNNNENVNNENVPKLTSEDIIEILREYNCEGMIYTPTNKFYINLPTSFNKLPENNNDNNNELDASKKKQKSSKNKKKQIEYSDGFYWDLGWVDPKNKLYYETSVFFSINSIPEREEFFEKFIEFLQIFIDKRIANDLFSFFNFENSILTLGNRYLAKNIFVNKLNIILDEGINRFNRELTEEEEIEEKERKKNKERFIEFICNILNGYDLQKNLIDNSISFNLLKKKISSNLKNFEDLNEESVSRMNDESSKL